MESDSLLAGGSWRAKVVWLEQLVGGSLEGEFDAGPPLQVPRVQPHGADSGCAAEKSSVESGDLDGGDLLGGNSGGLVERLAGGPLVPHDEKAEVQGGCGE